VNRLIYILPLMAFGIMVAFLVRGLFLPPPDVIPSALVDKHVPNFDLKPMDDVTPRFTQNDLSDNHVSIVNFFASWCIPCREEGEELLALSRVPGVKIYGVNFKDKPPDGRAFLNELGDPFSGIVSDNDGRNAINWGVYGAPETFLVDGHGIIRFKLVGAITQEMIQKEFLPAIEKAKQQS
jgi:cytochrome c biogenesis protein CcmG/thiol:disulfide interchange protein DsbE